MNPQPSHIETITIASEAENLSEVRDFVRVQAQRAGFDENDVARIVLAVDEACSNLIRHGYKFDSSHFLQVAIENEGNEFSIEVSDEAEPFDPLAVAPPDMTEYFKQFKHGGLGIHIINLVMDDVNYTPRSVDQPRNVLSLRKRLPPQ